MNLTQTILATNLSYIPANEPQIEICFGGVSPLGPRNGLTTCYGIFIPATNENPSVGIIIDNGTGIHDVIKFMNKRKPGRMILLQTHLHLDHMIGLRFNPHLFDRATTTHCLIHEHLLNYMQTVVSYPLHPVDMEIRGNDNNNLSSFERYGVTITSHDLPHGSETSTGFRIEALGRVIVVATDCELRTEEEQQKFALWSHDAKMIILDMKHDSEEKYHEGHGHNHPGLIHHTLGHWWNTSNSSAQTHLVLVHRDGPAVPEDFIRTVVIPWVRLIYRDAVKQISMPDDGDIISL